VTHSGDIMAFESQKGANNATIRFNQLGPHVQEVFVTLSAWANAMLSDIMQPYVQLKDPATGEDGLRMLCSTLRGTIIMTIMTIITITILIITTKIIITKIIIMVIVLIRP
jgi:hypothetical protein